MSVIYSVPGRSAIEPSGDRKQPLILQSPPPETVAIVHAAHPDGFVIINASDFDASVHVKHEPDAAPKKARSKPAASAPTSAA